MIKSPTLIEVLARRIALAYGRMSPERGSEASLLQASKASAEALLEAHLIDPELPLDPELFVISQNQRAKLLSPWADLAHPTAMRAYRKRIGKLVQSLHDELLWEIDHAERRVASGESLFRVLVRPDRKLTGMTRFLLAHRFGRAALANRFLHEAVVQHRACPLYRQATAGLLATNLYPDEALLVRIHIKERITALHKQREGATLTQWN